MKKLMLLMVALLFSAALVACGPPGLRVPQDRLIEWFELDDDFVWDSSSPNTTINYFHRMGAANEAQLVQWRDEFMQIHPNIYVNLVHTGGGYDDLQQRVLFEIADGTLETMPDVMESYPDHIFTYLDSRKPVALNNLITHPNVGMTARGNDWLDIFPFLREESQYDQSAVAGMEGHNAEYELNGSVMSLPFLKSTEVLIFNNRLLLEQGWEIPTTWEDWNAFAPTVRQQMQPGTTTPIFPIGYDSPGNWFITGAMQWGADYVLPWNPDTMNSVEDMVGFNNPEAWAMTDFFRQMVQAGFMGSREMLAPGGFLSAVFVAGRLFGSIGSSAGVRNSATNVAFGNNFDAPMRHTFPETLPAGTQHSGNRVFPGVAPIPYFEGKTPLQIQQGPNISMFYNGDTNRAVASWLWMQHLTSSEVNAEFITAYRHPLTGQAAPGNMASRASVMESFAFTQWVQETVPFPELRQSDLTLDHMRQLVNGVVTVGGATPQARIQNRLAFDTIMLSADLVDRYFTTPAFEFSSAMRAVAAPLINEIVLMTGTTEQVMPQIRERFDHFLNVVLGT